MELEEIECLVVIRYYVSYHLFYFIQKIKPNF